MFMNTMYPQTATSEANTKLLSGARKDDDRICRQPLTMNSEEGEEPGDCASCIEQEKELVGPVENVDKRVREKKFYFSFQFSSIVFNLI